MNFTPEQQEVLVVLDAMKAFLISAGSGSKFGVDLVFKQYTELRDALALQISKDIINNHKMFRGTK